MMEAPVKDEQLENLRGQVTVLEEQATNCDATTAECMKLKDLAEKETALYKEAYEREKMVTDKTMKLAEQSQKTPWGWLFGAGGIGLLIGIVLALLI